MKITIAVMIILLLQCVIVVNSDEPLEPTLDPSLEIYLPTGFNPEEHYAKNQNETPPMDNDTLLPLDIDPQDRTDYLIITSSTLWSTFNNNFKEWKIATDDKIDSISIVNVSTIILEPDCWVTGPYGDATNESNGNPWIEDGEQIGPSYYSLFNDTQCKIRNYIRKYVTEHNTKYVLLAGNKNNVPVRMVCSYSHSGPSGSWYNNTNHASDMYYSCLNHNFNNNTNSRWGENNFGPGIYWATVKSWDEIDYDYDVIVGRILAGTVAEANYWITKEKGYVDSNILTYHNSAILAAKDVSNHINDWVWNQIGDEFPDDIYFVNGQNITQAQWNIIDDYCNGDVSGWDGIALIYHSGHGGTLWTPYQPANLHNTQTGNFVYTEGCDSGNFGLTAVSEAEYWMRDDGGMVAGVVNSAYGWFEASTWYSEEMFKLMFNETEGVNERCFAKAHNDARLNVGWQLHSVAPMIVKETNFFGDPALEFKFWESTEYPANNSEYIGVYNVTLRYNTDITGDVSFYWGNDSLIGTVSDVLKGEYANITLADYLEPDWLMHDTIYEWYTEVDGKESSVFNFKTSKAFDVNEDEESDFVDGSILVDVYGWLGESGSIPSDINNDGEVDSLDVSIFCMNYREIF